MAPKKVLLLGWGKHYNEINYKPRCAPVALEEYNKLLSDAEITTLDLDIETDMVFNTGVLVLQPNIHNDFLQNI